MLGLLIVSSFWYCSLLGFELFGLGGHVCLFRFVFNSCVLMIGFV